MTDIFSYLTQNVVIYAG